MKKEETLKTKKRFNWGTTFTGMVIGFLSAAVLYQKKFPDWVPGIFSGRPTLFFLTFIVVCGIVGYLWAKADELEDE